MKQLTFALFFGNRGFFPGELIADARKEVSKAVEQAGHKWIAMDEGASRYGAVETREEGRKYAAFLKANAGKYDGVILSMPNFSDENGAQAALSEAGVPILVQAYRDMPGKMDFAHRRDSMCGKFAMCNVLRQCGIKYTIIPPFCADPSEKIFQEHLRRFAGICNIVKGLKRTNLGAIGARTTAFKTVRVDEIGLQQNGVNVETFDLSTIFRLMDKADAGKIAAKKKRILEITDFGYAEEKLEKISRLGVVVDDLIAEYDLNSVAIRCWDELEINYGVAPCLLLGELNERGIPAACEVDVSNAVMMRALYLAGETPPTLLDINNNFGMDDNKSILFHCGPVPVSLLKGNKGKTNEHLMFKKSYGPESGVGINIGEFRTNIDITFGSAKTEGGKIYTFLGEGHLTTDDIEKEFFGVGVVMEHPKMQEIVDYVGREGYRHHMSLTEGKNAFAVKEALTNYLGYEVHEF